jgi:signal transduction histidine kinase
VPDDLELLDRVADQIAPAIQNARMFAQERELRERLDQQNQDLIEAQAARKVFLSTVSHELKTPLTIISGFVDLLKDNAGGNLDEEQVETLGIIRRNASRLSLLINDMLDITRLDAGTFRVDPVDFDAIELVEEVSASFQGILEEKVQALAMDCPGQPIWLRADRNRIAQVVSNLISNASKYSPQGSEIRLSCAVTGERLEISVRDRGIGISPKDQQKLFTPFFRVDNEETRKVSGTGLGLVIAKSIAELHGGEIALESAPGEGTTVRLKLPGLLAGPSEAVDGGEFDPTVARSRLYPDVDIDDLALGA